MRSPSAPTVLLNPEADDDVLAIAARTDRQAFRLLYERYFPRIYGYCYLRLGSREAAEDATGDVFVKALAGLPRYRGGCFPAWLFRIAENVVADLRKRGRRAPASFALDQAAELIDDRQQPEDAVIGGIELARLRTALRSLPDDQRAVLELQLADLSSQEIAATLGRSLNAVRLLRHRAYERIRPLLIPVGESADTGRGGARW
jgi:RNA polymerase sigma-70 factor (ECF subfamily)